jgi:hypothetical protein
MGISAITRKLLWGRAGARCSFPGCQMKLIEYDETKLQGSVIGEEAHIIAKNKNGPRGKINIEETRIDLYENLILLCPNHHTIIDTQGDKYSEEIIYSMKRKHEVWVDNNLKRQNSLEEHHYIPDINYERYSNNRLIHIWKFPKIQILCYSFGLNPRQILSGIWKGSGLEFYRLNECETEAELFLIVYEVEPDVEYRCISEAFEVTHFTYDPRESDLTPLFTTRFDHINSVDQKTLSLRLIPEFAPISPILEFLHSSQRGFALEDIERNLYHLRNIGLPRPKHTLEILKSLWELPWCDGAAAETLKTIENQYKIFIDLDRFK